MLFLTVQFRSGSRLFKNLGAGSVRVRLHQNLKVRVRFGFIETKCLRFGSGSLNTNNTSFKGSFRVHRKKRFLLVRGSGSVRLPG